MKIAKRENSLTGDRVRLRALNTQDEEKLISFVNNPEVVQFSNAYTPVSDLQHRKWFEDTVLHSKNTWFGIESIESDPPELIGTCAFYAPNYLARVVEIASFRIGNPNNWSGGYGSEALELLVEYVLVELNMRRIWTPVFDTNPRSIRMFEKLGFKEEGRMRQEGYSRGKYCDMMILGLLRPEWEEYKKARDK